MIHVVLYQPEIPPNTGNIIRLCANVGATLHLIKPLGFAWDDKKLRRAGLDYHQWTSVSLYDDFPTYQKLFPQRRVLCCETSGKNCYSEMQFSLNDAIIFGSETRGLPDSVMQSVPEAQTFYLPMRENIRSLNLSNAVAVTVYEAWKQSNFVSVNSK